MTLYEILGVLPTATPDEIKAAYRRAAKQHHPDTGGCREEFQRAQHAYEILSDAFRRKYYDATGDEGLDIELPSPAQMLASAFEVALDQARGANPVQFVRMLMQERLQRERHELQKHEAEIAHWQKIRARIERQTGEAILETVIEGRIRPHQQGAARARGWIEGLLIALGLADGYRYRDGSQDEVLGDLLDHLARAARKRRAA